MTAVRLPHVKNLRRQRLLPLLAIMALAWAQLHGLHRGFVCDALGQEVMTSFDHCHGAGELDHHDEGHSEEGETHDHAEVVDSLTADRAAVVQVALSPVLWVVSTQFAFLTSPAAIPNAVASKQRPWPDPGGGRSWPEVLVQTIVLRV